MPWRCFTLILLGLLASPDAQASARYSVVQSVATAQGRLEILLDSRLTPDIQKLMWDQCTVIDSILDQGDPRLKPFLGDAVLPATFRQVDTKGQVVTSLVPNEQAPIARIEALKLGRAPDPVFLVDTDDDACQGSYSGRGVLLYQFAHGRIAPVMADKDGTPSQIYLFRSLKSDWRFVKRSPSHIEIEQVLCRPDDSHDKGSPNMPFLMYYITFGFNGRVWTEAERQKPGFWEADDDFPPRREFP